MISINGLAQVVEPGYYIFPVRPGQENFLSGTMGELRSTHFHTALDIKTSGITGLSVFASAGGYIQRIKVGIGGYGNALYLKHPNGTTTVYAHLKNFHSDIGDYVRKEQYKKESFTVDLYPPKDKFLFGKGDVIALSGNSGSSSGPHLHFEIRDPNNSILDPLKYGFTEIKDDLPPVLQQVAFVTMDKESRINGMYGRFEFKVMEVNGGYELEDPVTLFGNIGVEVYAYDRFNGAKNRNGIVKQTLFFDYAPLFNQNIEKLSFNKARNILVHMNYKRMKEGGRRFNKYYVSDGNLLDFYDLEGDRGVIQIMDPLEHSMDIRLEDSYGNVSQYHFDLNDKGYIKNTAFKNMFFLKSQSFDAGEKTLEIMSDTDSRDCFAQIFVQGVEHTIRHSYRADGRNFYLWQLDNGIPDSAKICDKIVQFDFQDMIPSNQRITYQHRDFDVEIPKYALFDTLFLRYQKSYNTTKNEEYFEFLHPDVPMRQSAEITLKPEYAYDISKASVYSVNSKGIKRYVGGEWDEGTISFGARDLVKYTIAADTIPPKVRRLKSTNNQLKFKLSDERSGVHSFRAELDNEWILMRFDGKSGALLSDEKLTLKGVFTLVVKDNANNFTRLEITL